MHRGSNVAGIASIGLRVPCHQEWAFCPESKGAIQPIILAAGPMFSMGPIACGGPNAWIGINELGPSISPRTCHYGLEKLASLRGIVADPAVFTRQNSYVRVSLACHPASFDQALSTSFACSYTRLH